MFTSETVLFTFRNEHVYFRNRLGSIFMAVAQVALAQPEKSHVNFHLEGTFVATSDSMTVNDL